MVAPSLEIVTSYRFSGDIGGGTEYRIGERSDEGKAIRSLDLGSRTSCTQPAHNKVEHVLQCYRRAFYPIQGDLTSSSQCSLSTEQR